MSTSTNLYFGASITVGTLGHRYRWYIAAQQYRLLVGLPPHVSWRMVTLRPTLVGSCFPRLTASLYRPSPAVVSVSVCEMPPSVCCVFQTLMFRGRSTLAARSHLPSCAFVRSHAATSQIARRPHDSMLARRGSRESTSASIKPTRFGRPARGTSVGWRSAPSVWDRYPFRRSVASMDAQVWRYRERWQGSTLPRVTSVGRDVPGYWVGLAGIVVRSWCPGGEPSPARVGRMYHEGTGSMAIWFVPRGSLDVWEIFTQYLAVRLLEVEPGCVVAERSEWG